MTEKLTGREAAVVYAARNKHKGEVMERRAAIYTDDHEFEARDQCIHCLLTRAQHRTPPASCSVCGWDLNAGVHNPEHDDYNHPFQLALSPDTTTSEHNQHTTLVEQRDRLLRLLRPVTSPTACYCAVMKDEKCWHCEARELIATVEQVS